MSQEFHILRCCSCELFQVHQVKKSKKWQCKVCYQKQSIKMVFGRGSGLNCRKHVQKLNLLGGQKKREIENELLYEDEVVICSKVPGSPKGGARPKATQNLVTAPTKSKWTTFLEEEKTDNCFVDDAKDTEMITKDYNGNRESENEAFYSSPILRNDHQKRKSDGNQLESSSKKLKNFPVNDVTNQPAELLIPKKNDFNSNEEWALSNHDVAEEHQLSSTMLFRSNDSPERISLEAAENIDPDSKWYKYLD